MKVTVERTALQTMLERLTLVAKAKHLMPICTTVLLKANQTLEGTASDIDRFLVTSTRARVQEPGAVCLPPRPVLSLLRATEEAKVNIAAEGPKVTVAAGDARMKLEGFPAEDFPPTPKVEGTTLAFPRLIEALGEVEYAALENWDRPALNGVCLTQEGKEAELAAADGYRLALTTTPVRGTIEAPIILPLATVRVLSCFSGAVKAVVSKETASLAVGDTTVITRLVQANFPNYKHLIPQNGHTLKVQTKALQDALRFISGMKPLNGIVRLESKGRQLRVWAKTEDEGLVEKSLPATGQTKIAFNIKLLKELVAHVGEELVLHTTSPGEVAKVKVGKTTHLLMPMVVQWEN